MALKLVNLYKRKFMKSIFYSFVLLFILSACTKTETIPTNTQTIITTDSSGLNGRLMVRVFDFATSQTINGVDVYIYARYEDIFKKLYLNTVRTNNSGNADFGYMLAGNYYLTASNNLKADTAITQIVSKNSVVKNLFLK